jgi:cell wall integrity and stress response component
MVLVRLVSLLAAASMLLTAAADDTPTSTIRKPITTPTTVVPARAQVSIGCFATSTPLESHGDYLYQSPGNCQLVCLQEGKDVFGVSDGKTCWCGDKIPPASSKVDDSSCDTICGGTDKEKCKWKICPKL